MKKKIKKVAVLGSGVMGSGIAAHFANIGLETVLLDIVPFNLTDEQKADKTARNSIVNGALKAATKARPAAFYDKSFVSRITTGNFDDNLDLIADADWIIEVIIEKLDIKRGLFEKVEAIRKPGSYVTSNTSSIPIHLLVEGRSDDFKKHFCGTHFFNPPRYLRLFEVIPHETSDPAMIDFFLEYGDKFLGKDTVLCKDTPAFIANRIGVMSGLKVFQLTDKYDLKIEEVDALTGPIINRPKTGSFRLQDLVGLDTAMKVNDFVVSACQDDEYISTLKDLETPKYMQFLIDNKFFGNKSKQGFYKRVKDENGKKSTLALNLKTLEYEPAIKPRMDSIGAARKIELTDKKLQTLIDHEDKGGQFLNEYFASLFAYSSNRVPEIADDIYSVDDAMAAGYAWDYGPFQYWDFIGVEKGIQIAEAHGNTVAQWVKDMVAAGNTSFYKTEDGQTKYYNIGSKSYQVVPGTEAFIILDNIRDKKPVFQNSECLVHDIGDGVLNFEFRSKANAIGTEMGQGLAETIRIAEEEGWNGIVIGNNAKNFSVGANLMNVGMLAMQKDFDTLGTMVDQFQQLTMRMRYSSIPVVVATQGYVFGGACEMLMHADAGAVAAESYIGLVEVGVGLIPGGSGTKEMAVRASDKFFEGDVEMPTLIDHFKPIATASVATSGHEAYGYNLMLKNKDEVIVNAKRNIAEAKKKVLALADGYMQPRFRKDVKVLGRAGLATLYTAINEFKLGNYMSEYDVEIARKVAYVMCGGDLTSAQQVDEQYLLDLEREAFLSLLGNQKTMDRIQHMLTTNKPLRN